VLGHAALVARLAAAAREQALSHAVLFTGPDGVGKTAAALALAETLLDAGAWPGGLHAHPDFWLEDSDVENISIRRVKPGGDEGPTLQDFLALRPYAGGVRVAVIARADRLGIEAANNILKSIEEPPPRTHLVLAAAHPEKLPQTVVSRCTSFTLAPVPVEAISTWLNEAHGVEHDRAASAALLAAGRPGRALHLATEQGALDTELDAVDAFVAAGGGGAAGAITAADAVAPGPGAEGRERALMTLSAWASFVRDAACYASGAPELALWRAYRPALERWAEDLSPSRIVEILHRLVTASEAVATYAQPRLAFEALMLDVFGGADSPPAVDPRVRDEARELSGAGAAGRPRRSRAARPGRSKGAG
jgi:DNA polymerase-3 subunit delta'